MTTTTSPRTPRTSPGSATGPPDTLVRRLLEVLGTLRARVSVVVWQEGRTVTFRIVWPGDDPDKLTRSLERALDRAGPPSLIVTVIPAEEASRGYAPQWSRVTHFAGGIRTADKISERVERYLRKLLAAPRPPRRRWFTGHISDRP